MSDDRVVKDEIIGKYRIITFEWEDTPRWLQFLGYKPKRQYTMQIPDLDGPGGWWRYDNGTYCGGA